MNSISQNNNNITNILALIHSYIKHWYLFVISIIGCLGLCFIYLKIKTPIYQVNASILIQSEDGKSSGNNIQRGKDLLNTIITTYNDNGIQTKNLEASQTAHFLNIRIDSIITELSEIEKKIELYKRSNNLTNIEAEAKIILEQNGIFKEKLVETETQRQIVSLIEKFMSDPQNKYSLMPFNSGLSDKSSIEAIQSYNELILKRLKLLQTAKPNSPTIKLIEQQIDANRENVQNTISNMKSGIEIALKDLHAQEKTFISRIKNMPTQEREFINIKRQQLIKEELYLFLLQKKEENAITLAVATPKGQIVDKAYNINKPVGATRLMLLSFSILIGLLLPIVYLYLRNIFKTKFGTRSELEALTDIPILGEICTNDTNENIVVKDGSTSPISELFRLLRSNIQFILNGKDEKVILVTSSTSGEGKSFISSNFAKTLALSRKKVILIGMDIRNPRLGDYLKLQNKYGLTNYLATNTITIPEIIVPKVLHDNMDIILAGPIPPNPAELLSSEKLKGLIDELKQTYDYIILDTAPVGLISDTFNFAYISDMTIYVCRANYTTKDNIRYANTLVQNNRLKKMSFVINATNAKQGYGYGYGNKNAQ